MLTKLLESKVALVTASTSGIGKEAARQLAVAGAEIVVINGRSQESGVRVQAELAAAVPATKFLFIAADLDQPANVDRLFATLQKDVGKLDILVHCGGAQVKPDLFINIDPATYTEQINGHFTSLMHCCRHAISLMTPAGGGSIVVIASDAGKVATPAETIIGATKAAAIMFTRTLALEVSRQNIRANILTPSIVADTKSYERIMSGETSRKVFEKAVAKAKLGVPSPKDIAPMVVFLASEMASKITGQAISINGGISAA